MKPKKKSINLKRTNDPYETEDETLRNAMLVGKLRDRFNKLNPERDDEDSSGSG